jgi:hypothetical protein
VHKKIAGKYYIGLIWLIFAATIITTVTLRLQSKGNAGKPLSAGAKKLFFGYLARILCMKLDFPPTHHLCRRKVSIDPYGRQFGESREPLLQVINGNVVVRSMKVDGRGFRKRTHFFLFRLMVPAKRR